MVNVTLGEAKPQDSKEFPKIVRWKSTGEIIHISEVQGKYEAFYFTGMFAGRVSTGFKYNPEKCEPYNGPITLQNA